ncbi:MAG TPA: trans-4-hydroxy-L-proline dehydratase [Bacteroidota bacterium]|nr:trans-4-hydroxy-L-proline dehydratase [Bacteroidota bacterium]
MTERVQTLRARSLDAVPSIAHERALLVTEAAREFAGMTPPMRRAHTFRTLMERQTVTIDEGELIVGERGPSAKATSTYPELCCHSLEDLEVLDTRQKISFRVSEETRRVYREQVIPFWKGKTMRERIFAAMDEEWIAAYEGGLFTEFMEQRAPGHTVLDGKLYTRGLLGLKADVTAALAALDASGEPAAAQDASREPTAAQAVIAPGDTDAEARRDELKAMAICADAVITLAGRYAECAERLAATADPERKGELLAIADVCRRVPANPPRTFHEALQAYWFVHLGVITELNPWDAFNPGRLDQHLAPFYARDLERGVLTRERAKELLECFWVKFNNQPAPPKVGVTAEESSTYTDFANINSGGLTAEGEDGVNDVTYLVLEVIDEMRLVQPSSNIQLSRANPDDFLKAAARIIRKGWGQPSVFNADAVVGELLRQGKSLRDAREGGTSGCVETGAFGKEAYILTGYFNLPKIVELTLHNGRDPRTGKQLGPATGDSAAFRTFDEFMHAFRTQVHHFVDVKIRGSNVIERLYAEFMPVPFLSLLIDDCIARGKDYNAGGARYNSSYIQGVGIGTVTDSLSSIRHHVFSEKSMSMADLMRVLESDFEGFQKTRLLLLNKTPRYGNDDDEADALMRSLFELYFKAIDGRPNTRGGAYRINLLPTTCHIYFGAVTGATPDGRKAWTPVSEGISPVQGADRRGPTAVLMSAAKMDHVRTGGTLLNQKFTPRVLEGEKGIESLSALIRAYFRMGGHHIQFNVVDAATLRHAQEHPEEHRDLIVRVAGYSDYFCDLGRALQDEIIARTEHTSM